MDLNQVTLTVVDFDEGVRFYQMLGFRLIVSARGEYARFEAPSGSSTLSLHKGARPSGDGPVLYFEVDDVDAAFVRLKAAGIVFDAPPRDEPWRWRETRFQDPAGNRLCLYHAGQDRRFPPWRLDAPKTSDR